MLRRFVNSAAAPACTVAAAPSSSWRFATVAAAAASPSVVIAVAAQSSSSSAKKPEWGSWNKPNEAGEEETLKGTDYYDSRRYMGRAGGATVIVRQKAVVKSYRERLWAYMKPRKDIDESWIDSLQLTKLVLYLIIPILMMIWWKGAYEKYPDYWEQQAAQLQSKPLSEATGKAKYSYHDVIVTLEDKREKAMKRAGYDTLSHMEKREDQVSK